ncbi:unnamed protein product [Lampetra fluviatilis]
MCLLLWLSGWATPQAARPKLERRSPTATALAVQLTTASRPAQPPSFTAPREAARASLRGTGDGCLPPAALSSNGREMRAMGPAASSSGPRSPWKRMDLGSLGGPRLLAAGARSLSLCLSGVFLPEAGTSRVFAFSCTWRVPLYPRRRAGRQGASRLRLCYPSPRGPPCLYPRPCVSAPVSVQASPVVVVAAAGDCEEEEDDAPGIPTRRASPSPRGARSRHVTAISLDP